MKITILLGFFLVFVSNLIFAQEIPNSSSSITQENDTKAKWDQALGSFQFEISNEKAESRNFQIDMSVIDHILESRAEEEIVYLEYNNFIRIKVLPFKVIRGDYEKLQVIKKVENFENL